MLTAAEPLTPPTLPIPEKLLPPLKALWMVVRNNLSTWPRQAYEEPLWRSRFFGAEILMVSDPAGVRYVLNEAAANYRRPVVAVRVLRPIGGAGVFGAEGADWRRQRRMLSPLFTPASIDLLTPHFQAAAAHLLRRLDGASQSNLSRDFQDAALEAVFRALFSLSDSPTREKLGLLLCDYLKGPGKPSALDAFARNEDDFGWFSRGRRKFRDKWRDAVDALIAARADEKQRANNPGQSRDLLDLLLAVRDAESGEALSIAEIRDQCATMLVAGFETTSRLMFWLSYLLALDGGEQEAIRDELRRFPPEKLTGLGDLAQWPRLRAALLEALRLYPPAAHVVRESIAEDVVCGLPIPAGTQIWISPWVIHRHRKYWDRPEAFTPDRFAGKPSPWSGGAPYMPFGAGPRICIGAAFAMAEAQIVLAALLARYRVSMADSAPVLPVGGVTISPSREPVFRLERI